MREFISRYFIYACVGVVVTVLAIGIRAVIGGMLPPDDPYYYAVSIVITYALGFLLSYAGHRFLTFAHIKQMANSTGRSFVAFSLIAILGMMVSLLISLLLRYQLPLAEMAGRHADSLAFAVGLVGASMVTFTLNRAFTFRAQEPG